MLRGLLTTAILGSLAYVAVSTFSGVPGKSYDYVTANVPRVGNLIAHDPVRLTGNRVGQVKSIDPASDGRTNVTLQIESGNELPVDTKVVLRANGLLGARYVELVPGRSARVLGEGDVIRGGEDSVTFVVTDALDTFDRETRGGLKSTLGELGTGLMGHGQELNDALRRGGAAIVPFQRLLRRLEQPPGALERLLPALDSAATPLDASREDLGRLFGVTAGALAPFVDRRSSVRDTLSEAPSALSAADRGLARGEELLAAARSLADEGRVALRRAPGGLRATTALLREGRVPLRRTRALLGAVRPSVPAVLRITSRISPLLRPLHELFSDLVPISTQIGRYKCDITNFGAVFRSMTGMGGFGEGPNGPAMGFRLQVASPVPTEALSLEDSTGLLHREGYPEPCKFLAKAYPQFVQRPGTGG